jgi:hypothetical protein
MPIKRFRTVLSSARSLLSTIKNARAIRAELAAEREVLAVKRAALVREKQAIQEQHKALDAESATLNSAKQVLPYFLLREKEKASFEERSRLPRAYAILVTTGRAATHWLTAAFNLHDEVFYSHGPDTDPKKGTSSESENLQNFLRNWAEMGKVDPDDPDAYFDMLETRKGHIAYGNIHGLMPPMTKPGENPFRRHYFVGAIFRHPVSRVQSLVNRWLFESRASDLRRAMNSPEKFKENQPEIYDTLVTDYGVEVVDEAAVLFVAAVRDTVPWDQHCIQSGMPLFQMERLVTDIDYFLALFHEATAGLVKPDDQFVQKVRDLRAIDQRGHGETAIDIFASWQPWMRKYFRDAVAKANLADAYHSVGYDLRMILR